MKKEIKLPWFNIGEKMNYRYLISEYNNNFYFVFFLFEFGFGFIFRL